MTAWNGKKRTKDKSQEEKARDVCRQILLRTFGWPDGTTVFGMEAEEMYKAVEWMQKKLWPERIELIDAIPRTATGKTQRFKLIEEIKERNKNRG